MADRVQVGSDTYELVEKKAVERVNNLVNCPFCDELTNTCLMDIENNTWKCYHCNRIGSATKVI